MDDQKPMPFEPRNYLRYTDYTTTLEPEPEPETWWTRALDRLIDWMTPGRFWSIYSCLLLAVMLGAWWLA